MTSARNAALPDQAAIAASDAGPTDEVLARIGQMTRTLHDSLRGLGLDKLLEKAADRMPEARDRLDYVARMSEQAAQRVLNATDAAAPLQDQIDSGAARLAADWQAAIGAPFAPTQYQHLAGQTLQYLNQTRGNAGATRAQLMDIMMAQDFQDLTGQVIKKVTELAQNLEQQLVQMLLDYSPADARRRIDGGINGNALLNGPQIKPVGNGDVVADQGQVDDLLDSLGF
ncbi:protein phosphatase CheZ [Undibacterium arcticum]|uniref:Protein phosphatase CheZ n=1 Tax=Undibacterium arcticum TaxID=1762892 RepID=A0ABV7F764_9BURK